MITTVLKISKYNILSKTHSYNSTKEIKSKTCVRFESATHRLLVYSSTDLATWKVIKYISHKTINKNKLSLFISKESITYNIINDWNIADTAYNTIQSINTYEEVAI